MILINLAGFFILLSFHGFNVMKNKTVVIDQLMTHFCWPWRQRLGPKAWNRNGLTCLIKAARKNSRPPFWSDPTIHRPDPISPKALAKNPLVYVLLASLLTKIALVASDQHVAISVHWKKLARSRAAELPVHPNAQVEGVFVDRSILNYYSSLPPSSSTNTQPKLKSSHVFANLTMQI